MENKYTLTGKLLKIGQVQEFNSGFSKCEFVVEIEGGKYPQPVSLEIHKDNITKLDPFSEGDTVTVSFNLRGRYYEPSDKYFTNLVAGRVEGEAGSEPRTEPKPQPEPPTREVSVGVGSDSNDEIPF